MRPTMDSLQFYRDRYLEYCTLNKKLAPSTIGGYRRELNSFILFLGNLDPPIPCWTEVKRKHLDHYLEAISENFTAHSIKGKFSSLRVFFYYMQDEGEDFDNPFRRFRLHMQKPLSIPISLTLGEVNEIGGMRVNELCGIRLSHYTSSERKREILAEMHPRKKLGLKSITPPKLPTATIDEVSLPKKDE